ncbi:uncharacterized protein LOC110025738 [Phalaenopsis equestris]|uniref:uncharacterized protein LOC110025738 n=1 Tax=Phalaenopsis equestris TaxID=78828 RepID=UPI0009E5990F|nr:uncharacterized protein LOC110025738 [Phalaenopsis equestris]
MAFSGRLRDLMKKYGKVALGVHLSVSAASITGFYVAIKNNVEVESLFEKFGLSSTVPHHQSPSGDSGASTEDPTSVILEDHEFPPPTAVDQGEQQPRLKNRTAELAASSGGALALAILCNKALFPIRVPITIGLTPPIARFLARRNVLKNV